MLKKKHGHYTLNVGTEVPEETVRVATVREKYLENEIFSRSRKSQGILWMARTWKVREKSGNWKINGYGSLSSGNLFIVFKKGKDVLSHEIV